MHQTSPKLYLQNYILVGAMLCYLFITQTLGPQLWHIPFVLTGQMTLFVIYFIYSFNSKYILFSGNKVETLLFITGCVALFIRYVNGSMKGSILYFSTTYIIPIIILLSLKHAPIICKNRIRHILYTFYIIECSFAIFERIIEYSFFPYTTIADFAEYQALHQTGAGFRSCSLLGNPLTNALIVTTIYPFLLFDLKKKWQIMALSALTLLGLSSFNARGATMAFFVIFSLNYFQKWILNGRNRIIHVITFIIISLSILLVFSQTEIAGRLFHGEKVIDKSAETRLTVLSQLNSLNFIDFFFGTPNSEKLLTENGVINFIILLGLPFLILYMYTYIKMFKYYLSRYSNLEKMLIFLGSFGVAALNPSFTSFNYIIFLIFGLTIFPYHHGKRLNNHSII